MKNSLFSLKFSKADGSVSEIVNPNDPYRMNWCSGTLGWGKIRFFHDNQIVSADGVQSIKGWEWLCAKETSESNELCRTVCENGDIRVTVERTFDEKGCLNERYTLKNLRKTDLFLEQGTVGITVPFNDIYTYADDCMTNRCNTHIWCGKNTTYISAVKMGESDINLGLVLTKGAFASYSLCCADKHSSRGVFVLDCPHLELLPDEEYSWNWKLFWFKDKTDFEKTVRGFENTISITAEHYTVFLGEPIRCKLQMCFSPRELTVKFGEAATNPIETDNGYEIEYYPRQTGDLRMTVKADETETYAEFYVSEKPEELIRKRLHFIAEKQQYKRRESALYGAYLIYDNKAKHLIFDSVTRDHNACRERMGMALLMCRYLRSHNDPVLRASLDKFTAFLEREFYDTETGEVFDGIGKDKRFVRLYNAPWVITFFTELYYLTEEKKYLRYCLKSMKLYYEGGGYRFYPNGFSLLQTYNAFKHAKMDTESEAVFTHFKNHVDNMAKIGLSYPKHEVNYEQTIVTPAATLISEFAQLSGDKKYLDEAGRHIRALERFNGHQPSCNMNKIPIRYWDDFWFGSGRMQGDTFPHYWSCLTARSFTDYYKAGGAEEYRNAAVECIRNCLCLFKADGTASCAYVYPYRLNDRFGEFYDTWANDQDYALYFYLTLFDGLEKDR